MRHANWGLIAALLFSVAFWCVTVLALVQMDRKRRER